MVISIVSSVVLLFLTVFINKELWKKSEWQKASKVLLTVLLWWVFTFLVLVIFVTEIIMTRVPTIQ